MIFKRFCLVGLILALLLSLCLPALAEDGLQSHMALKLSYYMPTGDFKDLDFGPSGGLAIMYGRYLNPNFSLEASLGFFHAEGDDSVFNYTPVFSDADLDISYIDITAKGVYPTGDWEVFAGGGLGIYQTELGIYYEGPSPPNPDSIVEDDTVLGYHIVLGGLYNLNPSWYLGLEARFLWLLESDFGGFKVDISGNFLTLNIGRRF